MQTYMRPRCEGYFALRALMKSALPLLSNAMASQAGSSFRVWGSWSDLLCHQRNYPSHRAEGLLALSIKSKCCSNTCQRPVCRNSHGCLFPLARGRLIVLVARQQRPNNPGIFVRHRHGRPIPPSTREQPSYPLAALVRLSLYPAQRRSCPVDQQLPHITIAPLADA
jgi:hypothetical protein